MSERPNPIERIQELALQRGKEPLDLDSTWSYSWDHGYERLDGPGFHYAGAFHPGDGCCDGNPCSYCGRAVIE